jgi:hypothetical protein
MDRIQQAKRYHHQAAELRAKADLMQDEEGRTQYLKMAETYEALAATEEQVVISNCGGAG